METQLTQSRSEGSQVPEGLPEHYENRGALLMRDLSALSDRVVSEVGIQLTQSTGQKGPTHLRSKLRAISMCTSK